MKAVSIFRVVKLTHLFLGRHASSPLQPRRGDRVHFAASPSLFFLSHSLHLQNNDTHPQSEVGHLPTSESARELPALFLRLLDCE